MPCADGLRRARAGPVGGKRHSPRLPGGDREGILGLHGRPVRSIHARLAPSSALPGRGRSRPGCPGGGLRLDDDPRSRPFGLGRRGRPDDHSGSPSEHVGRANPGADRDPRAGPDADAGPRPGGGAPHRPPRGPRPCRPPPDRRDDRRPGWNARPQSGFNAASVVWQAPAEGGIPRYMMVFAEGNPTSVGPVRSSRVYFVDVGRRVGRDLRPRRRIAPGRWRFSAEGRGPARLRRRRVPLGPDLPLADRPIAAPPTTSTRTASTCDRWRPASGPAASTRRPPGASPRTHRSRSGPQGPGSTSPTRQQGRLPLRPRHEHVPAVRRRRRPSSTRPSNRVVAPANVVVMDGRLRPLNTGTRPRRDAWRQPTSARGGPGSPRTGSCRGHVAEGRRGRPDPLLRCRRPPGRRSRSARRSCRSSRRGRPSSSSPASPSVEPARAAGRAVR